MQASDWVCCRSVQQLQQAVASIRQQQEQLGQHCYDRLGEVGRLSYILPSFKFTGSCLMPACLRC